MSSMNDRNLGSALYHVGKDRAVASNRQTTAFASVSPESFHFPHKLDIFLCCKEVGSN